MTSPTYSEQVLLANVLYVNPGGELADRMLSHPVDVFADSRNRAIAAAVHQLRSEHSTIDAATVMDSLSRTGRLDRAGGQQYIVGLSDSGLAVEAANAHLEAVIDRWRRTTTSTLLVEGQQRIERGEDPADVARWLGSAVDALGTAGVDASAMVTSAIREALALVETRRSDTSVGIPTGWSKFDDHIGGFRPGQLIVVGARPRVGKSVVSIGWASAAAAAGHGVCLFSLEMPREEVGLRLIAANGWLPFTPMFRGQPFSDNPDFDEQLNQRMRDTAHAVSQWPLLIADRAGMSVSEMRRQAAEFRRERVKAGADNPLSLVIIDYLALASPEPGTRPHDRRLFIEEATRACKSMAKDLGCAVVVMAQLNRNADDQTREPALSDLRESGSYEQDADMVVLLRREIATKMESGDPSDAEPADPNLHARLAKFRQGEAGIDFVRAWHGAYMTTDDPPAYGQTG